MEFGENIYLFFLIRQRKHQEQSRCAKEIQTGLRLTSNRAMNDGCVVTGHEEKTQSGRTACLCAAFKLLQMLVCV